MSQIELKHLCKAYGSFDAVEDFSLTLHSGECVGLVGESGCGKSTLASLILGLSKPTRGQILLDGKDVCCLRGKELKIYRRRVQMVFQDTASSLDPRRTAFESIAEPMKNFLGLSKKELRSEAVRLIKAVGLTEEDLDKTPGSFSGGQRQRIAIARAISIRPEFLVLDEVTASLDVSVQAHILNLLRDLQREYGLCYLFISHDLGVVRYMSDRVAVMYHGRLMEELPGEALTEAVHPYTRLLLDSVPAVDSKIPPLEPMPKAAPAHGTCPFYARCPKRTARCGEKRPVLKDCGPNHRAACFNQSTGE